MRVNIPMDFSFQCLFFLTLLLFPQPPLFVLAVVAIDAARLLDLVTDLYPTAFSYSSWQARWYPRSAIQSR
jgi:hypothetical protein